MIFYNWPRIKKFSNGKVKVIRSIFESILQTDTPLLGRSMYDRMDFSGDSYLLKPHNLLWAFQNSNQLDAANCLMLASYRNYAEYEIIGDCSLSTELVKIPIDTLKRNSLIEIKGTEIHFLTEK